LSAGAWAADDPGAVVIQDDGCKMLLAKKPPAAAFILNADIMYVETPGANNNAMRKCKANLDNDTGRPVKWDYSNTRIQCAVKTLEGDRQTKDWDEVISTSGQATLTCRYKK